MYVKINDLTYTVKRILKPDQVYTEQFIDVVKRNLNADTVLTDAAGNVLICKSVTDIFYNENLNKWEHRKLLNPPEEK